MSAPRYAVDRRAARPLALALALASHAPHARAQTGAEIVVRNELLTQARTEADAGRHEHALELAQRALRISVTPSLRLFVAERMVALGRTGPALGEAMICMREVDTATIVSNRDEIRSACRRLVETLQPRVARVHVVVPSAPPEGFELRIGGERVPETLLGLPYVVTPGSVAVEMHAPGYVTDHREVDVSAGETLEIAMRLEREQPTRRVAPTLGPRRPPEPEAPPPPLPPPPVRPSAEAPRRSFVGPAVLFGVGGAGLAAGTALGVAQLGATESFERENCDPANRGNCAPGTRDRAATLEGLALGANLAFVLGGASLVGGGAWLVVALLDRPHAPALTATPLATPGFVGLSLRGAL